MNADTDAKTASKQTRYQQSASQTVKSLTHVELQDFRGRNNT